MALEGGFRYATATDLAARVRDREVSPVELVDACIEAIEEHEGDLNAFVHLGFEDARERAREAERAVGAGAEPGPLHGVPTAMKDLFDFKPGWPTTFGGIRALAGFVPDFYCTYAERIEQAGAILVGKTNSPVMGLRGTCDNPLFGPTRNPFDRTLNSGGSSGGSAAAVAAGLLPLAEGTDGGGSIRIPAAWSGVYGYQPSYGRVPFIARPNAFSGTDPFLYEGPITRTVADAALALDALAGYDARDPLSIESTESFSEAVGSSIRGWRIAYSPDLDVFAVDPRVAGVVADAVRVFESAGAHVEEVRLGLEHDQRELSDVWSRIIMSVNVGGIETLKGGGLDLLADHREDLPPEYLRWLEEGYRMGHREIVADQIVRTEIFDALAGVFASYDLLVCPTVGCLPVPNGTDGNTVGPTEIDGVAVDPLIGWALTYFTNFTGNPAASLPAGLVDGRLPVGMQIIGRRYGDADVLAASAEFERLRPWQDIYRLVDAAAEASASRSPR